MKYHQYDSEGRAVEFDGPDPVPAWAVRLNSLMSSSGYAGSPIIEEGLTSGSDVVRFTDRATGEEVSRWDRDPVYQLRYGGESYPPGVPGPPDRDGRKTVYIPRL